MEFYPFGISTQVNQLRRHTAATMKKELMKDFPPNASVRYEALESVLGKALDASKQHFNVDKAMTDIYGEEEVATFGKETLQVFFDSGLNKIRTEVLARMQDYCREKQIPEQLLKLETSALKFEREATWEQHLEKEDHTSAQTALEQAKSPYGYTAEDVVQFQIHQELAFQQAALEEELTKIQAEIAQLEQQSQQVTESSQHQAEKVAHLATEMENAADVAAAISK